VVGKRMDGLFLNPIVANLARDPLESLARVKRRRMTMVLGKAVPGLDLGDLHHHTHPLNLQANLASPSQVREVQTKKGGLDHGVLPLLMVGTLPSRKASLARPSQANRVMASGSYFHHHLVGTTTTDGQAPKKKSPAESLERVVVPVDLERVAKARNRSQNLNRVGRHLPR
jgi:hypothetical protein